MKGGEMDTISTVIQREIDWCKGHKAPQTAIQRAYTDGLEQAKDIASAWEILATNAGVLNAVTSEAGTGTKVSSLDSKPVCPPHVFELDGGPCTKCSKTWIEIQNLA
jgi:hypothetical protein